MAMANNMYRARRNVSMYVCERNDSLSMAGIIGVSDVSVWKA